DAWRRHAHACDVAVDLVARQLAAFAGLRALRHLDLQLVCIREVVRVHAEATRGDLLDRGAAIVAVADGSLAAFARVRAAADAVHRLGKRLVRFAGDRAK